MHSAPTLGTAYAHTAGALCRVAGLAWPCCRPGPAVSQAPLDVSLRPRVRWRAVSQAVCYALCRAPYRSVGHRVMCPLRRIVAHCCTVSQPWLRCIATQRSPLSHITMFCIATPPAQAMRALALPYAPHAGWPCRGLYRGPTMSCRGRGLAVSWPLQLCPATLCHDTIHCIVTHMGSSPSSCLLSFFFFTSFFFSYSKYWKTTKKIYIFFFIF